ncbi:MAG: ribbon-helix-helix domain-containing protein [Bdellovibrionales bacterium]
MSDAQNTKHDTKHGPETRLSVRLKGPLAAHADRRVSSALYESHSEYIRDLVRKDMLDDQGYDLREGIIQGYADLAAGRFSNKTNDEIFDEAMKAYEDYAYSNLN